MISKNKDAKWNFAHSFLIVFHLLENFLYEEANLDQNTYL